MKIETKLSPGDEAWLLSENKVVSTEVRHVRTHSSTDGMLIGHTHVSYFLRFDNSSTAYDETQVFASKEELLASL